MKVVFISNFFNHHQEPFSLEMANSVEEYYFVATAPLNKERIALGYEDMNAKYPFIIRAYESQESKTFAIKVIKEADFVIYGSAPEEYIYDRIESGKTVFYYSERIYKKPPNPLKFPVRVLKLKKKYRAYKNQFMLCASAYTPYDFARSKAFIGRTYKWGYFPKTMVYDDVDGLIEKKEPCSILWAGRFIGWKHPEFALKLAKALKSDGYPHRIKIVGAGEMEDDLKNTATDWNLDNVEFCGSFPPEKVRNLMEKTEIFIFTSNREEGWGAVLNEAMNSACAVVGSSACGSVPFLIDDGENGVIFRSEDFCDFYGKVKSLTDNPTKRKEISLKAYRTITDEWNASVAVKKFLSLCNEILSGAEIPEGAPCGVCSKAEILKG